MHKSIEERNKSMISCATSVIGKNLDSVVIVRTIAVKIDLHWLWFVFVCDVFY